MILEVAILDVKPNQEQEFEKVFKEAQKIISSMNGYISHQLQKCIEKTNRYITFSKLEGFRRSHHWFSRVKRISRMACFTSSFL